MLCKNGKSKVICCNEQLLNFKKEKDEISSEKLKEINFVISGTFILKSREELKQLIEKNGGYVKSSISNKIQYLLCGENAGPSKILKAKSLKIKIIDEKLDLEILGSSDSNGDWKSQLQLFYRY